MSQTALGKDKQIKLDTRTKLSDRTDYDYGTLEQTRQQKIKDFLESQRRQFCFNHPDKVALFFCGQELQE